MGKRLSAVLLMVGLLFMMNAGAFAADRYYDVSMISTHYNISPTLVVRYETELGSLEDVDRALFISQQTGIAPETIIHLYLGGESFAVIAGKYGMAMGDYMTPVADVPLFVNADLGMTLSQRYGVSHDTLIGYYNQLGNWNDVDKALFIAQQSGVDPETVIQMHLNGDSFDDIAYRYGVSMSAYFPPATNVPPSAQVGIGVTLANHYAIDIGLVNKYYDELGNWDDVDRALYISSRTGVSPDAIIQSRLQGMSFDEIAEEYNMAYGTYDTPVANVPIEVGADLGPGLSQHYGIDLSLVRGYYDELGNWGDVDRALYISSVTGVTPEQVIGMYLGGTSFADIASESGMSVGTYYTPVANVPLVVAMEGIGTGVAYAEAPYYGSDFPNIYLGRDGLWHMS